jgi:hypothetical protein
MTLWTIDCEGTDRRRPVRKVLFEAFLRPAIQEPFRQGERVVIRGFLMNGITGTLVRPTRMLNGKRAWLVQFDRPLGGLKRARVAEYAIIPAERPPNTGPVSQQ